MLHELMLKMTLYLKFEFNLIICVLLVKSSNCEIQLSNSNWVFPNPFAINRCSQLSSTGQKGCKQKRLCRASLTPSEKGLLAKNVAA